MRRPNPEQDAKRLAAKRLRTRRKLFGISAERMAFAMGLTAAQYERMESAKEAITSSQLEELASLLNVPTRYFLSSIVE